MKQVPKVNEVSDFLDKVCQQIRWKKAHLAVTKELEAHIEDQRNVYILNGECEEVALKKAIKVY